jgi:membrane-associated PAP2 superfamily phosphatase
VKRATATTLDWAIPVVVLVGLSVPFWTGDLDVSVARRYHEPGAGWPRGGDSPWDFLYHYGVIPAWVVSVSALVVFLASFRRTRLRVHRRAAAFLVLVMVVGPGLVVNNLYKENWGRPRPRDLVVFGGERDYVAPLVKSPREHGNSFVSGHAATGFYLLTPYFLLRRRARARALAVLAVGLAYGSLMGLARMIQGAHFLSDVLWALGFVYLTALAFFYLLRLDRDGPAAPPGTRKQVSDCRATAYR